ncbi:MAG: MBL fold metallo-hydrolase [Thermoplasmata archaeon]|nr:MBL fold metallo-hydrolase [Thermoplasmata archaeon]MCK5397471.1 MBL fold metallo-hydrolase [Thermoplasmata archaeon]
MRIRWHGHACFEFEDENEIVLVTDPHDGKSIGIKQPVVIADIVTMSHDHFDHNAERIVQGNDKKLVTGSRARTVKGIPINGVDSFHDEEKGAKRGENVMYKFEMDGLNICHLGDLGELLDEKQVSQIGEVDILFIPVGGTFTLDAEGAWKTIKEINPRVVVPMHFRVGGLSLSISSVDGFLEMVDSDLVVKVGNEIELTRDDFPEGQEVWVFSL